MSRRNYRYHRRILRFSILKGKSAEYLRREFPELGENTGACISACGYFVSTGVSTAMW